MFWIEISLMYSYQNNYVLFARVNLNSMPLWVFVCYISPVRVIENNLLRSHDFCHYLYYHKNLAPFTMSRNFLNKFFWVQPRWFLFCFAVTCKRVLSFMARAILWWKQFSPLVFVAKSFEITRFMQMYKIIHGRLMDLYFIGFVCKL